MSPLALPQLRSLPSISCVPYSGVKQEDVGVTAAAGRITQARPISRHGEGERGEEQRKKYQRTGGSYPTGSGKRPLYSRRASAVGFPIWLDVVAPWIEGVIYCTWADLPSLPPSNRSLSRQTALPPSPSWSGPTASNSTGSVGRSGLWTGGIWSNYVNVSRRHCPQRPDGRRGRGRGPLRRERGLRMYTTMTVNMETAHSEIRHKRTAPTMSYEVCDRLSPSTAFEGSFVESLQFVKYFLLLYRKCFGPYLGGKSTRKIFLWN